MITTPDPLLPPPLRDAGPLEAMARTILPAMLETSEGYSDVPPEHVWTRPRYQWLAEAAQRHANDAIAALLEAGYTLVRKDDLHELLRTANVTREALDMGTRYERGAGGMTIDAQIARTVIGNVPASVVEPLHLAIAAFAPLNTKEGE